LPAFDPQAAPADAGPSFGPYSATTFSTIRQRWNMNAVRIPLSAASFLGDDAAFHKLGGIMRNANRLELLVILAAREPPEFWARCAAYFKTWPNVMFDVSGEQPRELVKAIRDTGANQPILVGGIDRLTADSLLDAPNIIYEVNPKYSTTRTDRDRYEHFGFLASQVPVLVNEGDLHLDQKAEPCASLPSDPSEVERLVKANLLYFDALGISWTASVFEPGELITDYRKQDATSLENGWTCGTPAALRPGLGTVVQLHLWGAEFRGLYAVNGAGGFRLPRGGVAILYGPIFADRDRQASGKRPPEALGKVSVEVTDALGVSRPAGLLYASAGWGQANFIVPDGSAPGPARVTVVRADGSSTAANTTIVDSAPSLWTALRNGRGPVIGFAVQHGADGKPSEVPTFRCDEAGCRTMPVVIASDRPTSVRLMGTGFRNAGSGADVRVELAGIPIPVTGLGPAPDPGVDQVTIQIPSSLRSLGEADLLCSVGGRLSNVVRISVGSPPLPSEPPASGIPAAP